MRIRVGSPTGLRTTVRIAAVVVEVVSARLVEVASGILLSCGRIGIVTVVCFRFVSAVVARSLARSPVIPDIDWVGHLESISGLAGRHEGRVLCHGR